MVLAGEACGIFHRGLYVDTDYGRAIMAERNTAETEAAEKMSHTRCDRCDQVSGCCLNFDGAPCRKLRSAEPNNFDRLHEMDVKSLADFFVMCHACPPNWPDFCMQYYENGRGGIGCNACWCAWLEEEQKRKRGKTT